MAIYKDFWICEDCVEKFGSYDAAAYICQVKKELGLDKVPKALLDEIDKEYDYYMQMNFHKQEEE